MPGDAEIFISYAHADNPPRYESRDWETARGWVESFYHTLSERIRQVRGRPAEVWRDQSGRIRGASALTDTIKDGIQKSSILIAVTSPSYLGSEWCEAELRFFERAWAERGGVRAGNMMRIFKVNKLPVPSPSFLASVEGLMDSTGYDFHRCVNGDPLEFDPPHGVIPGNDFCQRINTLAYDVVSVLDQRAPVPASGISVFLADCTADVREQQDRLRTELRQHGHVTVPGWDYRPTSDLDQLIRSGLARSRMSIHVIGGDYGMIPERFATSIVEREYDLAGEEAQRRPGYVRLSWVPPGTTAAEPRQAEFIERLKFDAHLAGASVSLEDFKTIVKDEIEKTTHSTTDAAPAAATDGLKRVYLVFDAPDKEGAKRVDDWLFDQGFEVLKPVAGADAAAYRKIHNGRLKAADGVLIYHGHAGDEWLEAKLDELWKVFASNRNRNPPTARGVVLADPETPYKAEFRARIARVIPGFGRFSPEMLKEFVSDLRGRDASG